MSHSNIAACRFGAFWSRLPLPRQSWFLGAGSLPLYLLLDWASYVQAVRHTSITPWNPTAGLVMALLLVRGSRWAPLVALGIFVGELLTDDAPAPWRVLAVASGYLALVYTLAAWGLRRRGLDQPIGTPKAAAWFAGVTAVASGFAAAGYVAILVSGGVLNSSQAWTSVGRYWIGEFNGIIALTPVLLLRVDRAPLWQEIRRHKRELMLQALGAVVGVALAFALAAARDVRLVYPLFAPVAWVALRHGVPGAMVSVSLLHAALAAALTHELNQPMTALLSYVRAAELMSESPGGADERLAGTLRKAGEQARRATAVLRRLREFYRGEGGRPEPTDALALCARVADALQDRMRRSVVQFELRRRERPPSVLVDRTQLEIVIHNLLTNCLDAFDSLPSRGLKPRRIEVAAEVRGAGVLITVDDSGPGIAPGLSERLFEPFVTNKMTGMGLGLSLSRTFLRHQGGDLWSEPSRLGGARFVIRLATEPTPQTSL